MKIKIIDKMDNKEEISREVEVEVDQEEARGVEAEGDQEVDQEEDHKTEIEDQGDLNFKIN